MNINAWNGRIKVVGPPRGFEEQENKAKVNWGTGEQRQNILGNKGTLTIKGIFREQGNTSKFLKWYCDQKNQFKKKKVN